MLLEVLPTDKLSQTRHAVNAFGFTPVLAVQLCQAEVAAASHAGVRQQAEMGEAVLQESNLLGKGQCAVCAFEMAVAPPPPMACKGFQGRKIAATFFTCNIQHIFVQLHMVFTRLQGRKHAFAQVTLVKLILKVSSGQVVIQIFLRRKALPTDTAHETIHFGLGMRAQVDPVVVNLAEAFSTFGTAVRACSSVQVHVVLQLEFGG